MKDCLFCKIANSQTDTELVWQSDTVAAFKDIHPSAPVHILVVPKKHYDSIEAVGVSAVIGELMTDALEVARIVGVQGNHRLTINTGPHTAQIEHLHVHILGGKPLDE